MQIVLNLETGTSKSKEKKLKLLRIWKSIKYKMFVCLQKVVAYSVMKITKEISWAERFVVYNFVYGLRVIVIQNLNSSKSLLS